MTLPDLLSVNDVQYRRWVVPPQPARTLPADYHFVRVLHELELPAARRLTPLNRPEVRPMFPNHYVPFGRSWQMLSWDLNNRAWFSAGNMTAIYHTHLWIANRTGFGDTTPRANYFENTNLTADPLRVENLTCGGNILRVLGEVTVKTSGTTPVPCYVVETLNRRETPTLAGLLARPWLITTAVNITGERVPHRFPQGNKPDGTKPGVRHPLACDPVTYPQIVIEKWRVVDWTEPEPPDPYRVYLPYG